jgi:ubiquinol-cytochrome c reductase cytochrome c1 subunit
MKKILARLVAAGLFAVTGTGIVFAQEEGHSAAEPTHFPIHKPKQEDWSFAGPFGKFDKAQLQRGLKVYKEVCSACHSMNLVAFRTLEDLGYSEAQVKAFAAEYTIQDGPNADGEMFERPGIPSDYFPSPFPNKEAAAAANNGAPPPDFSLIAKARGVERGFPTFVFDIFTQYAEGGPDYIHSLLTGYDEQPPEGMEIAEGTHYNPYFIAGKSLAMAPPLSDDQVTYDDGAPQTVDQYARDVSAFLMWAAEPHLEARKQTGLGVMVFLLLFAGLVYLTKRKIWHGLHDEPAAALATPAPAAKPVTRAVAHAPAVAVTPAAEPVAEPVAFVGTVPPATEKGRPAPIERPAQFDDLKLISGVGPKIEGILHDLGIYTYKQVAGWTKTERAWVDTYLNFKGRIEREDWVKQAKALAKGGVAEYVRVFGKKPR